MSEQRFFKREYVTTIVDRTNNHQIVSFQTDNPKLNKVLTSFVVDDLNGNRNCCLDLLDGGSDEL